MPQGQQPQPPPPEVLMMLQQQQRQQPQGPFPAFIQQQQIPINFGHQQPGMPGNNLPPDPAILSMLGRMPMAPPPHPQMMAGMPPGMMIGRLHNRYYKRI